MFKSVVALTALLLLAAVGGAQPKHGDLILTTYHYSFQSGTTAYLSPANPGTLNTIMVSSPGFVHNWVRMAPNNTDLVISEATGTSWSTPSRLLESDPNGRLLRTLATTKGHINGYELDHDDTWVMVTNNAGFGQNLLLGLSHTLGSLKTFFSLPGSSHGFNEMAIDRDPGAPVYAIANCYLNTCPASGVKIYGADRQGRITSIFKGPGNPLLQLRGIELHPRSGDYVVVDAMGPLSGEPNGVGVNRVTKSGILTTLHSILGANAARITQGDHAWVVTGLGLSTKILKYDLSRNAVVTILPVHPPAGSLGMTGIEVYGSRVLVCNQKSPATVTVNVQSRLPGARGQQYALAASFARRPAPPAKCLQFPNIGEYLFLDATDPLFYLSALNLLPGVFQNFQGVLDPWGNNPGNRPITVQIPQPLQGSGITIFVAGVIFNQTTGVIQVTNTHWFVP